MNATTIKTGDLVMVCGKWAGEVRYVCADGMIGVNIYGEGKRVDEWHPTQVEPIG